MVKIPGDTEDTLIIKHLDLSVRASLGAYASPITSIIHCLLSMRVVGGRESLAKEAEAKLQGYLVYRVSD